MWHKVKVYAPVGTEFAIVRNSDGTLELMYRTPGGEWPHGLTPIGGEMTIEPGCSSYAVIGQTNLSESSGERTAG